MSNTIPCSFGRPLLPSPCKGANRLGEDATIADMNRRIDKNKVLIMYKEDCVFLGVIISRHARKSCRSLTMVKRASTRSKRCGGQEADNPDRTTD